MDVYHHGRTEGVQSVLNSVERKNLKRTRPETIEEVIERANKYPPVTDIASINDPFYEREGEPANSNDNSIVVDDDTNTNRCSRSSSIVSTSSEIAEKNQKHERNTPIVINADNEMERQVSSSTSSSGKRPNVTIRSFQILDETKKVTIFVPFDGIGKHPQDKIKVIYRDETVDAKSNRPGCPEVVLLVENYQNQDHTLTLYACTTCHRHRSLMTHLHKLADPTSAKLCIKENKIKMKFEKKPQVSLFGARDARWVDTAPAVEKKSTTVF